MILLAYLLTYLCLGLWVHCLGLNLEPHCLGLGLEPQCIGLGLGLGTYCLAPITDYICSVQYGIYLMYI